MRPDPSNSSAVPPSANWVMTAPARPIQVDRHRVIFRCGLVGVSRPLPLLDRVDEVQHGSFGDYAFGDREVSHDATEPAR